MLLPYASLEVSRLGLIVFPCACSASEFARRASQAHMFVDPRRRVGLDRPGIHHFATLQNREAIGKAKHEGQMLLDHQHRGAALAMAKRIC